MTKIYLTTFFILLGVFPLLTYSQKLSNKQKGSFRAPANINMDGYSTEWGDLYHAYNKATDVFYTIANDDENLYLIIHAVKPRIVEKIIEGGISFTISVQGKKNENVTVLFPLLAMSSCRSILLHAGKQVSELSSHGYAYLTQDSLKLKNVSVQVANEQLAEKLKEIKISGISAIIDTVAGVTNKTHYYANLPLRSHYFKIISVDNKDNIKAIARFDKDGNITYELSLPIKYLLLGKNATQKISYNITLNSRGEDGRGGDIIRFSPPPNKMMLDQDLESSTDFSGEYTLAQKP